MNENDRQLLEVYALASDGDRDAYRWLLGFHGWCHRIDDHVDEDHARPEVVDLCADGVVLCASPFFAQYSEALAPAVASVAEQYRASLEVKEPKLVDALRIAGNQVVLLVAYLRGGRPLQRQVSKRLWPIVAATQLQ